MLHLQVKQAAPALRLLRLLRPIPLGLVSKLAKLDVSLQPAARRSNMADLIQTLCRS